MKYADTLRSVPNNSHYLDRYIKFIGSRDNTHIKFVEKHHICPVSMFGDLKNERDNLIRLTPREHFIAHMILWKAYGGSMTHAFFLMSHANSESGKGFVVKCSRVYEALRAQYAIVRREDMSKKSWYTNGVDDVFAVECPDGYVSGRTNIHRQNKGSLWYNDGTTSRKFFPGDAIPDGWVRGRVFTKSKEERSKAASASRIGKKWYTNGDEERYCVDCPEGWRQGRCDGWRESMSGYTHSDESKSKISAANKGKEITDEAKEKYRDTMQKKKDSGEYVHPMQGKRHSPETKAKISQARKEYLTTLQS